MGCRMRELKSKCPVQHPQEVGEGSKSPYISDLHSSPQLAIKVGTCLLAQVGHVGCMLASRDAMAQKICP